MKLRILYLIISIFFICNLFLLFYLNNGKSTHKLESNFGEKKVEQKITLSILKTEMSELNRNCILLNSNFEEVHFSDLIKDGSILILKFSQLNCRSCVDFNFEVLKSCLNKDITLSKNIVILCENSNLRDITLLSRSLNNKIPIFQIKVPGSLNLNIDVLNIPYFFLLDNSFYPKGVFVSNKEFPASTEEYFRISYLYNSKSF